MAASPPAAPLGHEFHVVAGPVPRGAIEVLGDANFTATAGVSSGDGTADSPYVISGYRIVPDRTAAIRLVGTRAHVLLEDLEVVAVPGPASAAMGCLLSLDDPICTVARGLELTDAQNVTIRNLRIPQPPLGALILRSRGVALEGLLVGDPASSSAPIVGIRIEDSAQVTVRGAVVAAAFPAQIFGGEGIHIAWATFHGMAERSGRVVALRAPATGVAFEDSRFEDAGMRIEGQIHRLAIRRSFFLGPSAAVGNGLGTVSGLEFCGNEVRDTEGVAGVALLGHDLRILHNVIQNNTIGVLTGPYHNLEMVGNRVTGNREEGVWSQSVPARVVGNAIEGNAFGSYFPVNGTDARENWWGAASGPAGIGPGTGETLRTRPGVQLPFDPWLTEPPLHEAACGSASPRPPSPDWPLLAVEVGWAATAAP